MRFMVMHKMTPPLEAGVRDDAVIADMGRLIGELIAEGKFLKGTGLKRSAERVRVNRRAGALTVSHGSTRRDQELPAWFVALRLDTLDQAVAWATRLAEAQGEHDAEIDVGPVVEPWDIGLAPPPEGQVPLQVLLVHKADARYEAGESVPPEVAARIQAVLDDMAREGVLLATYHLAPSARAARLTSRGGRHLWTDGPFAETKEMISGFTLRTADSFAEVKAWTERYADVLGDIEVDVREVV